MHEDNIHGFRCDNDECEAFEATHVDNFMAPGWYTTTVDGNTEIHYCSISCAVQAKSLFKAQEGYMPIVNNEVTDCPECGHSLTVCSCDGSEATETSYDACCDSCTDRWEGERLRAEQTNEEEEEVETFLSITQDWVANAMQEIATELKRDK